MSSKLGAAWRAFAILLSAPGIGNAQQRIFPHVPSFERPESLALIAHDGLSTQRQFFGEESRYVSLEVRFDP